MPVWSAPPLPARWTAVAAPVFVGRSRELARLEVAWAAVRQGARQVVAVGGEPGAGKSRLVAEAASALHRRGAAVLLGRCVAEFRSPYAPLDEPLAALLPVLDGADDLLRTLLGRDDGADRSAEGRTYQRDLYEAAAEAVRAAAQLGPLVLVLEDLHLAGPGALELLTHLVERTAGTAVLLLVTHRTTPADRSDLLTRVISTLYRDEGVGRLDLPGLDTEEITDYLLAESGLSLARARPIAARLRDQTGGNPFFLRELWRDLSSGNRAGAAAPQSVRDMLHSRLADLSPAARHLLEMAAVVGDDFDVATVSAAAGSGPQQTLEAVDAAAALGLVAPLPGSGAGFHFLHALARQAVLDLMPASRQAVAHARIGEVLEQRVPQTDALVPRLAHHFSHACALGHTDRAVRYLTAAGRLADRALAHEEAAGLCEQAAALCPDPEQQDELRLAAAHSHLLAGSFDRGAALYEQVATAGVASLRLVAAVGFEHAKWRAGEPGGRAVELLSSEMKRVGHDVTHPTYVRALAGLGRAMAYTGAHDEGAALCDASLGHARAVGTDDLVADALEACMGWGLVPARAGQKLARAQELSLLADRTGELRYLANAAYNRVVLCYLRGDLDGLDAAQGELARAARVTGQSVWAYAAGTIACGRQYLAGDLAGARRTCAELRDLGQSFSSLEPDGPYGVQMFMLQRESGALERVRALVTGDEAPGEHWAPGLLGVYTELQLAEPCTRVLHALLADSLGSADHARHAGVLALAAEAALYLRDRDAARTLRPLLAAYEGRNLALGAFDALFGSADRYLAGLDELLGQGDPEALYVRALELDTAMGATLHRAHTLAQHALYLRRTGSPRAGALAAEALAVARPLGLVRVLRLLDAQAPPERTARGDGLTARELDVLELLGEGLSNRAIAGRLVISENTAANHVRSILAKTGSQNRTQAAMYGRQRSSTGS